jgi:hypothetical protein
MQTNPYLCINDMAGNWMDLNSPGNVSSGGTNWAASAETGKDYQVSVKITQDAVSISIDGEEIALSTVYSGDMKTGADILNLISTCDQFTFGVGASATSFWGTELSVIKDFSAKAVCKTIVESGDDNSGEEETVDAIEQISDNSWKINASDALLLIDNPVSGKELSKLQISYDVMFADNAAKNGWDGLFSFYNPDTAARVSVQSAPYICFNAMSDSDNIWADINNPSLDGATDWAASAQTGVTYHVEIAITGDTLVMTVDGETIAFAQNTSDNFTGYQNILDAISACPNVTIGVGLAQASFWNTELCTLSNLLITTEEGKDDSADDTGKDNTTGSGNENNAAVGTGSGSDNGNNAAAGTGTSGTVTDSSAGKTESSASAGTVTVKPDKKIAVGKKVSLKKAASKKLSTTKKITWSSSNTRYAKVSKTGVVTTKKAGIGKTVTITAKTSSGKKATFRIKIMKGVVKKVTASTAKKTVKAGSSITIKTSVKATKGANKKLTFTSSNTKYATVTSKGVVKAKKAGKGKTVTITVAATDGSRKKATVKLKIK